MSGTRCRVEPSCAARTRGARRRGERERRGRQAFAPWVDPHTQHPRLLTHATHSSFHSHPALAPGDAVAVILAGGASLDANPLARYTAPAALKLGECVRVVGGRWGASARERGARALNGEAEPTCRFRLRGALSRQGNAGARVPRPSRATPPLDTCIHAATSVAGERGGTRRAGGHKRRPIPGRKAPTTFDPLPPQATPRSSTCPSPTA